MSATSDPNASRPVGFDPKHPLMRGFGIGILLLVGVVSFAFTGCEDTDLRNNTRAAFQQVHGIEQSIVDKLVAQEKRIAKLEKQLKPQGKATKK